MPGGLTVLGTDGFGRSDAAPELRRFFEVDAESIAFAALYELAQQERFDTQALLRARDDLNIDKKKTAPWKC